MAHRPVGALELPVATGTRINGHPPGPAVGFTGVGRRGRADARRRPVHARLPRRHPPDPRTRRRRGVGPARGAGGSPPSATSTVPADLLVEMKEPLRRCRWIWPIPPWCWAIRAWRRRCASWSPGSTDGHDELEVWVLRAAADHADPAPLRGLLHISKAAEGPRRPGLPDGVARGEGRGRAPHPGDRPGRLRRGRRGLPGCRGIPRGRVLPGRVGAEHRTRLHRADHPAGSAGTCTGRGGRRCCRRETR